MSISFEEYEAFDPRVKIKYEGSDVVFATPNRHTAWRAQTLFTKEPDTIEWIASFDPGDILFDVGANVGMYTIWAAKTRSARVYAFEPESQNYALLNKNIFINQLDKLVEAYCVAISDETRLDRLFLSRFILGGSCHNFGESVDFKHEKFSASFTQGSISTSIDRLTIGDRLLPIPNHIKIDVDGIEDKVILGALKTLEQKDVRSVLIEINTNLESHWEIVDLMLDLGFDYSRSQVEQAQRKEGTFKGVGNYVFRR